MKPEVLDKKILEINHVLRNNIKSHPNLCGSIAIILEFNDGGITGYEVNTKEKNKFRLN